MSTDCQGSQVISLIMDVYRLALKVNRELFQYFILNWRTTFIVYKERILSWVSLACYKQSNLYKRTRFIKRTVVPKFCPCSQGFSLLIGHFPVAFGLLFKARLSAKPFIWKWVFIHLQMKPSSSVSKVLHLTSFWNRGKTQHGSDLLEIPYTGLASLRSNLPFLYVFEKHGLKAHCPQGFSVLTGKRSGKKIERSHLLSGRRH